MSEDPPNLRKLTPPLNGTTTNSKNYLRKSKTTKHPDTKNTNRTSFLINFKKTIDLSTRHINIRNNRQTMIKDLSETLLMVTTSRKEAIRTNTVLSTSEKSKRVTMASITISQTRRRSMFKMNPSTILGTTMLMVETNLETNNGTNTMKKATINTISKDNHSIPTQNNTKKTLGTLTMIKDKSYSLVHEKWLIKKTRRNITVRRIGATLQKKRNQSNTQITNTTSLTNSHCKDKSKNWGTTKRGLTKRKKSIYTIKTTTQISSSTKIVSKSRL
jgi:hypothetical protein